jgi:spore germination cell wall hydrolase CwlJ-like protein
MKLALILWFASLFQPPVADRTCLAATIYLEARGESVMGQTAVAEVAQHRLESRQWGNSLCSVVTAPGQFALSTTNKNFVVDDVDAWRQAWMVAGMSMLQWSLPPQMRMSLVPNADHFFASEMIANPPAWAKGQPLAVIGDHRFYRVD